MTQPGAILMSVAIAYLWAGRRWVRECMSADLMQKPFWAYKPTVGKILLVIVTWPFHVAMTNMYGHPGHEIRYGNLTLVEIALRILPVATIVFLACLWRGLYS